MYILNYHPCNGDIGGTVKGSMTHEIYAKLGGECVMRIALFTSPHMHTGFPTLCEVISI